MKNNYTHLVFLIDRSGSMLNRWNLTIESIQNFFNQQKEVAGEMTVSLVTFDSKSYHSVFDFVNVRDISCLSSISRPNHGNTPLYDSFCKLVDSTGWHLASMPDSDRPEKILFVVVTDGAENCSVRYRLTDVQNRIKVQKETYSWNFTFLGADFDAVSMARDYGVNPEYCLNYASSKTKGTFHNLSSAVTGFRNSQSRSLDQSYTTSLNGQ